MTATRALLAAIAVNLALGTFYAWSVFVQPYEALLQSSRSEISSVFSLATVCFVAAMLFGPTLHRHLSAARLALICTAMGACGLVLAGSANSLSVVLLGYGVLFGVANGLGYATALQIASRALPERRGLALGLVVAAYAGGAAVAAPLIARLLAQFGLEAALYSLAAVLILTGLLAAWLLRGAPGLSRDGSRGRADATTHGWLFARMWVAYSLGATAGLMMIGHATGLIEDTGVSTRIALMGPILVSIGNGVGRIGAGWLSDFVPVHRVLSGSTAAATAALLVHIAVPSTWTALAAVAVTGTAYGILAAAYPVAVAQYFGPEQVARIYGRLFTAWGVGGIAGPYLAARSFDISGGYATAVAVACSATGLATVLTMTIGPRDRDT